jgi:hypothetical protein
VQLVLARHEDKIVIGGHQRLVAARRLGWKTVPVIFLDVTDEQAHLLNLVLNKISGNWDQDLLARLPADLEQSPVLPSRVVSRRAGSTYIAPGAEESNKGGRPRWRVRAGSSWPRRRRPSSWARPARPYSSCGRGCGQRRPKPRGSASVRRGRGQETRGATLSSARRGMLQAWDSR